MWSDDLVAAVIDTYGEEQGNSVIRTYGKAFRSSYREDFSAKMAVCDIQYMLLLNEEHPLEMSFYRSASSDRINQFAFKLFHRDRFIPLSDIMPILENMGLRILGERPYHITTNEGKLVFIHDFNVIHNDDAEFNIVDVKDNFREVFMRVWSGSMENDGFNRLVLSAQLNWKEITLMRAYIKYMRQIGFTLSQAYMEETLVRNGSIVKLLVALFNERFDPESSSDDEKQKEITDRIIDELDTIAILDEDRILRRLLEIINATLRTNFFQKDREDHAKLYLSFKIASRTIPEMPLPLPMFEVFVYSSHFEGVHLRNAKVARGGLRWSERREDFRKEILDLMKAQVVKNAVIVPSGAKGGFVAKTLPDDGSRDVIMAEVVDCYSHFIRGLLDITDNFKHDKIIKPVDVKCYDEDDPYLVVAADKGTATFSDIANAVSKDYDFWLGDAFASGGSAGYDHKKNGNYGTWCLGFR